VPSSDDAAVIELFQRAQNAFTDAIDAVEAAQWDDEALPGWTVADLVAHLVDEARGIPDLLAGSAAPQGLSPGTDEVLGHDPLGAWESAADEALAALATTDLDGTVQRSGIPTSVREHVEVLTVALAVHAWDVARATGGEERLDPSLLRAAEDVADRWPGVDRAGLFQPPLSASEAVVEQVRVLARFGRRG
jgi:uncharacterized protein (TIGR03086 family)